MLLLDLHTDFSGGRSGGLVFPSLEEFFTVCCDSYRQRLWHSQKAEIDVFSGTLLLFQWSTDVGHLISGSSAFSKSCLNIWKFTVHVLLKPGFENSEHSFASVWDACICAVVWACFSIAFIWDWNEIDLFQSCGHCCFPNLLAYWGQHFTIYFCLWKYV